LLGDTRSRTSPPTARHPYTQKQANTREPTDQNGCDGGVEISHSDWGGDRESDNPANKCATPIPAREPLQLGESDNGDPDPEDASDDRPGEEPGLACCVAKNRPDDRT